MADDGMTAHIGHAFDVNTRFLAHSMQYTLWPQGIRAATTGRSEHRAQPLLGVELGDGLVGGYDHTPAGDSKLGDSPKPSSRSRSAEDQMLASPGAPQPDPEDTEPDDENAPDEHEAGAGVVSIRLRSAPNPVRQRAPRISGSSPATPDDGCPLPVRTAM